VKRDAELNVTKIVGCFDREDESAKWGDATAAVMRLGVRRILSGEVKVRSDIASSVLLACLDNDADWDADVSDCVLQAGLLNGIVYG
jgi:hypothetical protein